MPSSPARLATSCLVLAALVAPGADARPVGDDPALHVAHGLPVAAAEPTGTGPVLRTPSSVPWEVLVEATNTPATGGTVDFDATITPTSDLARLVVGFATDGNVTLGDDPSTELTDLTAGTPVMLSGSLDIAGPGRGTLFVQVELFETTACGDEPVIAQEDAFYVLDDGESVFTGGGSTIQLELQRIEDLLDAGEITPEEAEALEDLLLAGTGVDEDPPPTILPPPPGGGNVTINGTAQWTDSGGGTHPSRLVTVKAFIAGPGSTLVEVGSTTATTSGTFTLSLDPADLGASPRDITVRVFSDNFATNVRTPPGGATGGKEYYLQRVLASVADGATVNGVTITANNTTQQDRAWSIADAMIVGNEYVQAVEGPTPAKIPTNFPRSGTGTASFYSSSTTTMNIHPSKPFAWDVLLHEYGHYIADLYSLDDSPGGSHACNEDLVASKGKSDGIRLAWGEGLATYLGIAAQAVMDTASMNVPNAGDTSYHSVTSTGTAWQYDLETRDRCNGTGEGVETNVGRVLWDVADAAPDGDDQVAFGHAAVWALLRGMTDPDSLSDDWLATIDGQTTATKILLGKIFAQNKVSAQALAPNDGASIPAMPPTFQWRKNTLNDFRVRFYDAEASEIGASPDLDDTDTWTPSQAEWDAIRNAAEDTILWVVEGGNDDDRDTGVYWGDCRRMGGVDFAFVIDDTGSMSQEIGAVVTALLNFIAGFDAEDEVTFQLTTFKDNVTVREPTSDLVTIEGQVASLFASGGGDCPEQSVGGLSEGTLAIRNGGTVLFATDADPRPGSDLGALIAQLQASGARVNVLLSGTCTGTLTSPGWGDSAIADQWSGPPEDPVAATVSPWLAPSGATLDVPGAAAAAGPSGGRSAAGPTEGGDTWDGAADAYSQIAAATGGTFAFIPGVNGFGTTEYENTAENILSAAVEPRIVTVTPSVLPQGVTASVTVKGQNTTFLGSTSLSIEGLTVGDIEVVDPVTVTVDITVAEDAPAGFYDATAMTVLGGGAVEEAFGLGVIEVTTPGFGAELISASPAVVRPGQTVDVTVVGQGTTFTDSSGEGEIVADFGSGITIDAIEVVSDTELTVALTVDADPVLAFRTVSITTQTQFVTSFEPDIFRVEAEAPVGVPLVTGVVPPQGDIGTSLSITIDVTDLELSSSETAVEFTGEGITVDSVAACGDQVVVEITIAGDAPAGSRDVIITSQGSEAIGIDGFVVVSPKERLFLRRASWVIGWKNHAKGKPRDKVKLAGVIGRAGLDLETAMLTMDVAINDVSLGELVLERKGRNWKGKAGGAKGSLKSNGSFSYSLSKADVRAAFPELDGSEDGKGSMEVDVSVEFAGGGLESPVVRNTLDMTTKAKAGKSIKGSFSFGKNASLLGAFQVSKGKAKVDKKTGNEVFTLAGPFAAPGGEPIDVDLDDCSEITVVIGDAPPIVFTSCDLKRGGKDDKTKYKLDADVDGLKAFGWDNKKQVFGLKTTAIAAGLPDSGDADLEVDVDVQILLTDDEGTEHSFLATVPLTRKSPKKTSWKH